MCRIPPGGISLMCDEASHHDAGKRRNVGYQLLFGQEAAFRDGLRLISDFPDL